MKKFFLSLFLILSSLLQAQWIRRADIQGNITDIAYLGDETFIAGTNGSGVFVTFDNGSNWEAKVDGLPDFNVRAVCGIKTPNGQHIYIKVGLSNGEVYYWDLLDSSQTRFLLDGNWPSNSGRIIEDMAMVRDYVTGNYYTFVATDGHGIFMQNGLNSNWSSYKPGKFIKWKSISCLTLEDSRGFVVIAGRKDLPQIWYMYGNSSIWEQATINSPPQQGAITSISIHSDNFMIASAEEAGKGIYFSTNFSNWSRLCSNPPNMPIYSADYASTSGTYCVAAGTPYGVYSIKANSPGGCVDDYTPFTNYKGKISTISVESANFAFAGGPLKGPASFNPCEPSSNFAYRRSGFNDYNVNFITVSPNYGSGDHTIFAASGVAGIYKNIDIIDSSSDTKRGYFYRIFSEFDEDAVLPVNKVKIPPSGYLESGCLSEKTIYALTDGDGLWISLYGGREWDDINAGVLNGSRITDMAFVSNSQFFVSSYGKDVYKTTDGGQTYSATNIPNKSVLALAVSSTNVLFAGCTTDVDFTPDPEGLYEFIHGTWVHINNSIGMIISRIIFDPQFSSNGYVYIGTKNNGVWRYNYSNGSFTSLNNGLPPNSIILDLKLSPNFSVDGYMLVAALDQDGTRNNRVYYSNNRGNSWYYIGNDNINDRITSVEFSANFSQDSQIFAGTAHLGLFDGTLGSGGANWRKTGGFFNVPPNITGISIAPDNPKVVFASTMYDGVFKSIDGGDTFLPWSSNLRYFNGTQYCPVPNILSIAVTERILYLSENFSSGIPASWSKWNGGTPWSWRTDNPCGRNIGEPLSAPFAIIDSNCEGSSGIQDDWLVTPPVNTSSADKVILQFDHHFKFYAGNGLDYGRVKVCSSAIGGNCSSPSGNWVTVRTFTNRDYGPEKFTIDLTAYKGTNFRVAFHYTGAYDWWWAIDNVLIFDPQRRRVIVGTNGQGIYFGDFLDYAPGYSYFNQTNKNNGIINEIRYLNSTEDLRAADATGGDWASSNFGEIWYQVPGASYGLTDISYGSGLVRGINQFVWGCSSGKSVSLRSGVCNYQGRAWYRPVGGTWTQCQTTGLNTCEDFRSIIQIGSSSILLGSIDIGGSGNWVGLYRSDDSCTSFKPSVEGLPQNPKVYALYQNTGADKFILAAIEDSDPALPDYGGIYFSDASSKGRAWVKTNLPSATPSSWEVSSTPSGTIIYAGLSSDGIFSSLPSSIPISVPPTAYFEVQSEACVNTPVQFYEFSAGRATEWYWSFGDGEYSNQRNPVHTYTSSGTFYPSLTVYNSNGSDYYPNNSYDISITVKEKLDLGNTLRVIKTSNPNEIKIFWEDLDEETGYRVYASNIPSAYQTYFPDLPQNTTSYTTTSNYTFFRVQPLSTTHICGNGIIGGSW